MGHVRSWLVLFVIAMVSSCNVLVTETALVTDSNFRPGVSDETITAPVAANITPAPFSEDSESGVITLSYTDSNGDLATSCNIFALSGVTETDPCSCDGLGVCTVKVTGTADTNGVASFSYTVTANAEVSNTATASFIMTPINDLPTLTTISTLVSAVEDTPFTISYSDLATAANEADVDGDTLSFRVEAVSTGTLAKDGVAVTEGTTLLSAGESLVWTPASNDNGTLNAFTVSAFDGALSSSTAIQVEIITAAVNDAPTLTTIGTLTGATEDTAFTISYADLAAVADEADVDGDTLSFEVQVVSTGTLTKGGDAVTAGSTLLSSGESLVWTPSANAVGNLNAFTVKAHDGTTVSSSAIQVQVQVEPDLLDGDNSSLGFAGGKKVGVEWNTNSINKLILGPDTDCDGNMSEGETVYTNCAELDESWTPQWSSLVGYWKMNESSWNGTSGEVIDSSGKNHPGVRRGSASTTSASKLGSHAGVLNGAGDYVEVANSTDFDLIASATFTAWIYMNSAGGRIIDRATAGSADGYSIDTVGGFLRICMGGAACPSTTQSLPVARWTQIAVTYQASGTYALYIDGDLKRTAGFRTNSAPSYPLRIGSANPTPGNYFNGKIDDVAIWSTALTASEIQTIYNRQSAKYTGSFTSRVMNYGSSNTWDGLKWLTTLPFGKELTGDANDSGTITGADSETSTDYPTLVGSNGNTSDNDLMSGLAGLWHFNSTLGTIADDAVITDFSGYGNHGAAKDVDAANNIRYDYGRFSSAVKLDGVNDYISIPDSAVIRDYDVSDSITLAAWVRRLGTSVAWSPLISKVHGSNIYLRNYELVFPGTGLNALPNSIAFFFRNSANTSWSGYASATTYTDSEWHHYAFTFTYGTADSAKLYVDGSLVAGSWTDGSGSNAPSGTSNGSLILGSTMPTAEYFSGWIDEVAIWNRALHPDEVKQLYRRGANRIKHQVKSCIDVACNCKSYGAGGSSTDCDGDGILNASDTSDVNKSIWIGPDNTNQSYFSELNNYAPYNHEVNDCSAANLALTGSPNLLFECFTGTLSNLNPNQYFQYRSILESDDTSSNCNYGNGPTWCSPELKSLEVK